MTHAHRFGQACEVQTSPDAPMNVRITCSGINIYPTAADLVWSPIFQKFRGLKVALAEGGIGWIPYFLERVDYTYEHHKAWTRPDLGGRLPSEIFREHIITCFIADDFGVRNLDAHERRHGLLGVRLPALRQHLAPLARSGLGQRAARLRRRADRQDHARQRHAAVLLRPVLGPCPGSAAPSARCATKQRAMTSRRSPGGVKERRITTLGEFVAMGKR